MCSSTLEKSSSESTPTVVTEVSKARIAALYPGLRPLANRVIEDVYLMTKRKVGIAEGMRSMDHQLSLYAKGRKLFNGQWIVVDSKLIVTNAKPGLSYHCYGLAFDIAWLGADPYLEKETQATQDLMWKTYGDVGKAHGLSWGGDFKLVNGARDLPHLEMKYGLSISECVELYERGGLKAVWAYIDQMRGVPQGEAWNLPANFPEQENA